MALLAAVTVTVLVARNIFFETLVFGDTPLVGHQSPEIIWQYCFNMWTPAAYGDNMPKPQCYILLYIFSKIASTLGETAVYSFLLHLSLPLSFLSFYFYSQKFSNNVLARIFGATFYTVNPVTIAYFAAGAFTWTLVFLPLSMNYFIDFLEEQKLQNTLKAGLFTSLTVWTLPSMALIMFSALLVTAVSYMATAKNKRDYVERLWPHIVVYGLILVLCSFPYIYSTVTYIQSPSFNFGENMLSDFQYTYQEATIPNLLRLAGNEGSPQTLLDYNSSGNPSNMAGWIIPLFAFASIIWVRSSEKKRRLVAALALQFFTLFSVVFLRFACNSDLKWIITDMLIVWTLRNPFKIQLLMLTAVTPLFTFTTEKLSCSCLRLLRRKKLKWAAATMALTLLAVAHMYFYNAFAFNGYMGIDKYPGIGQATADETLSCIVNDSLSWPDGGSFRGIILPFDHKTELYVEYSNMFLYPSRLGQKSTISNILGKALSEGVNLENFLRLFSVKYVYVNNKWEDADFYIIQPQNPQKILALLNETGKTIENGEYCRVTVENALPTVYISQYPIFYSDIETVNFLGASAFQNKPVFIEVKKQGCNITTDGGKTSKTFHYTFTSPYPAAYDLYAVVYVEKPETPLCYRLDDWEMEEKRVADWKNPLNEIANLQLQSGSHSLTLAVDGLYRFADLNYSFTNYGNGLFNVEGQKITVENGTLIGLKDFENFELTLKLKAENYGEKTWYGPYVYFAFTEGFYFRIIFHANGYVELARYAEGTYQSLTLKQTKTNFKDWNSLRLVKLLDTVNLYLNDQYVFSFKDPTLSKTGKVGLGSYCSKTIFDEASISPNIIRGIWLIPDGKKQTCSAKILESAAGHYALQLNNSENSWLMLFLGENYDPLWEATINGETVTQHLKANCYGNLWIFNASQGLFTIQISYKPNVAYKRLFSISLIAETVMIVATYLPTKILKAALGKARKRALLK